MAQFIITIPNDIVVRVVNAISSNHNYKETLEDPDDPDGPGIPNPESRGDFSKRMVRRWIKQHVVAYEANNAGGIARESTSFQADADTDTVTVT